MGFITDIVIGTTCRALVKETEDPNHQNERCSSILQYLANNEVTPQLVMDAAFMGVTLAVIPLLLLLVGFLIGFYCGKEYIFSRQLSRKRTARKK